LPLTHGYSPSIGRQADPIGGQEPVGGHGLDRTVRLQERAVRLQKEQLDGSSEELNGSSEELDGSSEESDGYLEATDRFAARVSAPRLPMRP